MARPRKNPSTYAKALAEDSDFYETLNTTYDFVENWAADFLQMNKGTRRHQIIVDATRSYNGGFPPFGDSQNALKGVAGGEEIYNLMWMGQTGPETNYAASKWCVVNHVHTMLTA